MEFSALGNSCSDAEYVVLRLLQVTGSGHVHGHGQNRTSPTSAFPEDALAPGPAGPYQHGFHHVPQGLVRNHAHAGYLGYGTKGSCP